MSATMEGIDAKGYLSGWLQGLTGMYTADINAIPEEKWCANFGGCTRTACELTADAIAMIDWTTEAMKGNVISGGEEDYMKKVAGDCATKAGAIAKLQASSNA